MQVGLLLPLSVTGFVWAFSDVGSGNLLVPRTHSHLHALSRVWNTRVFLGSYRQAVKYCTVVCREVR